MEGIAETTKGSERTAEIRPERDGMTSARRDVSEDVLVLVAHHPLVFEPTGVLLVSRTARLERLYPRRQKLFDRLLAVEELPCSTI